MLKQTPKIYRFLFNFFFVFSGEYAPSFALLIEIPDTKITGSLSSTKQFLGLLQVLLEMMCFLLPWVLCVFFFFIAVTLMVKLDFSLAPTQTLHNKQR